MPDDTPHSYCAIHHRLEPETEGEIWCPECWHVFADDWALIAEYNWGLIAMGQPPRQVPEDLIFFCPLCLHDF